MDPSHSSPVDTYEKEKEKEKESSTLGAWVKAALCRVVACRKYPNQVGPNACDSAHGYLHHAVSKS